MATFNLSWLGRVNTRAYQRLPAAWPIKCELQTEGNGRHITSTGDVSAGGVSIIIQDKIPVGSKIRIEIHVIPLGRSITAMGQVTRCNPTPAGTRFELGIRFTEIDPRDRIVLNEAIEEAYGPRRYHHQPWWRRFF